VGIEILGLLAASAGASYGWWRLQQRREKKLLDVVHDPDLHIVLSVAQHEANTRGHVYLWPLHMLHGIVQNEAFVAAIGKLGGDATAFESFVQDELDKHKEHDERATVQGTRVYQYTLGIARALDRAATCNDLWSRLARTDDGKAAAAAAKVDPTALLFLLVHGMLEPSLDLPDRTDVHVVLRNDDHTTQEFVTYVLRDVFELSAEDAEERMWQTHKEGRAIVGRYKLAVARDKVGTVRNRAREGGFPLWIGVEDC
jgi:ATP-dependent Clp protease adaptor protein ClpS